MSHTVPAFSVDVRNFALLNYRVSAERVRALVPSVYELDTFEDECFVTATCFCNERFRPFRLPGPHLTFDESTFRTYVTHKGRAGVYFFGRYLSRKAATIAQRVLARHTYEADFAVSTGLGAGGYDSYWMHATSGEEEASFALAAKQRPKAIEPFGSGTELAQFFTYRLHGFFTGATGMQGHMPVSHPRMDPWLGELSAARLDLFDRLDLVSPEQVQDPHSVLVEREVPFTLFAPRPLV